MAHADLPPLQTSPLTIAELDGDCQDYAFLPGHIEVGAEVPCPDGDHDHQVLNVIHTAVVHNIEVTSTEVRILD